MDAEITGKDEEVVAMAIAIASSHLHDTGLPQTLLDTAAASPLALYIAIKYLQSLPEWDEERINEHPMKAILLSRYPDFVEQALKTDPQPADMADISFGRHPNHYFVT
jgi:hypothetical protein